MWDHRSSKQSPSCSVCCWLAGQRLMRSWRGGWWGAVFRVNLHLQILKSDLDWEKHPVSSLRFCFTDPPLFHGPHSFPVSQNGNTANLLLMRLLTVLLTSIQVPMGLLRRHGRGENRVSVGPGIGFHSLCPSSLREGTTCEFPLETGPGPELLERENA